MAGDLEKTRIERHGNQWYSVTYDNDTEIKKEPFTGDAKVTIWRVQNKHGYGPYNQSFEGNILLTLMDTEDGKYVKKPHPQEDTVLNTIFQKSADQEYLYGFSSIEQFEKWFESEDIKQTLHDNGFYLASYEIDLQKDKALIGDHQAVFTKDHALLNAFRKCNNPDTDLNQAEIKDNADIQAFLGKQHTAMKL